MVQPAATQMDEDWVDEASDDEAEGDDEAQALQPRLLALVRAASGEPEGRAGVWMEHSYARAKSGATAIRVLLARPPSPSPTEPDVVTPPADPIIIAGDEPPPEVEESDEEETTPDWETRVLNLAPTPAYHRLARSAIDALLDLRLARLASGPTVTASMRRDDARNAARLLRYALAPLWAVNGPHGGPVSWLVSTINAHVGKALGALWREMLCELRGAVPRLAARLVPAPPPPPPDPLDRIGAAVGAAEPGPWLVWLAAGAGEARWARRLRARLHTRLLRAAAAPAAPAAWAAAAAAQARQALLDIIAEAGTRPVVVGGAGAGAALAGALLAGGAAAARALLLLAPPLLTAEGDTTHLNRHELDIPLLVVVGSAGAACERGAAYELVAGGGAGAARRVLEVRGADDALRLPARLRRRLRVPQAALEAAIVDECARWAMQAAEGEPPNRRTPKKGACELVEERRTMQAARGLLRELPESVAVAVGEQSRVVSRGPAATPLALLPPRRAPPAAPELDIMQLPIVFADDEPSLPAPTPLPAPALAPALAPAPALKRPETSGSPSVTVTSGHPRGGRALNYTRVIVAKRRGGAARGAGGAAAAAGGAGGARPVLLRRTVRLLHKARPH